MSILWDDIVLTCRTFSLPGLACPQLWQKFENFRCSASQFAHIMPETDIDRLLTKVLRDNSGCAPSVAQSNDILTPEVVFFSRRSSLALVLSMISVIVSGSKAACKSKSSRISCSITSSIPVCSSASMSGKCESSKSSFICG
eukprot:CAMPEP_0169206748 /NCGR_PEP_ID=MMETSP1016-20121227/13208_1 /TAXON_ID=342587 /ORGANISM="Karlodinium micrum, Strain CCMP2283" /LENGTH=141 /DNA_ID=CAMNT_0009283965 /DNA_START=81 /DNA_END=503 /DNA_ORIENTATION=-